MVCVDADQEAQDYINTLPAEARTRVLDIDFARLFGGNCPHHNHVTKEFKEKKPKKDRKEKDRCKKEEKKKATESSETACKPTVSFAPKPTILGGATSSAPVRATEAPSVPIAQMVASVAGGVAADYLEICETLKEFSLDEIIEIVLSTPEVFNIKKEDPKPTNPARIIESTPTGEITIAVEKKPEPVIPKEAPKPAVSEKAPEVE